MRKRIAAVLAATATTCLAATAAGQAHADVVAPAPGNATITGANRYATAVTVSKKAFNPSVPLVVLATGQNWPDGLAGAAIAGNLNGPLLLTPSTSLRADVKAELQRLNPGAVMIAGASSAVSAGVESAVKQALPGKVVFRNYGPNRYATAAAMSKDLYSTGSQTIYVASGRNFPDAVGASSPAALSAGPILLADTTLPAETKNELARLKAAGTVENVIVLGGSSTVSNTVFAQINTMFGKGADGYDKTVRVAGANRYDTTAKLADILWDPSTSPAAKTSYFVDGAAWADALAAGPAAAAHDAPVLLTTKSCMPAPTKGWDTRNAKTITARRWVGGITATTKAC